MQPRVFEKLFHGIAINEKGKVAFKREKVKNC